MKKTVSSKLQSGMIAGQTIDANKKEISRDLRKNMTGAEKILWKSLRANRLMGIKFRRQQVIGRLVADFYCHEFGLVIEVDGSVHDKKLDSDKFRDDYLRASGLEVLRFRNENVIFNLDSVLDKILTVCESLDARKNLSPSPSPKEGGG